MRKNRGLFVLLALILPVVNSAQDRLPMKVEVEVSGCAPKSAKERIHLRQKIEVSNSLPDFFKGGKENKIDSAKWMWNTMKWFARLSDGSEDTLRILHIGDSHVRGHIFPRTTGEKLARTYGALLYQDMGVNGATCLTFTHAERIEDIVAFAPDLLIMSFGTNESHGRGYNAEIHYRQIDELVGLLNDSLPGLSILMTTPAGSYDSFRRKKRKRIYAVNPRTQKASNVIKKYANEHQIPVWDLYEIVGGKDYACFNWMQGQMMRPDHVHYMPAGYSLQGELLYEALIKAYNEYLTNWCPD